MFKLSFVNIFETIMTKTQRRQDWHPEDIKAAVRKAGKTLTDLAIENGLSESACRKSLNVAAPRSDQVIAEFLNLPLHELWPSRYDRENRRVIIHVREQHKQFSRNAHRLNAGSR